MGSLPGTAPLIRRARRVAAARRAFTNWPAVCGQFAIALSGRELASFVVATRDGIRIEAPHQRSALWPLLEVLAEDEYHLSELGHLAFEGVIDIGAHVGSFTCLAGSRFPDATLVAVEPSRSAARWLRSNLALNGLAPRTAVIEAALAGRSGTVEFWSVSEAACDSSMQRVQGVVPVEVPSLTFPDLLTHAPAGRLLVKMDCEGGEYSAVLNSPGEAWERVDALLVEYHRIEGQGFDALSKRLYEYGFHSRWHDPSGPGMGVAGFTR